MKKPVKKGVNKGFSDPFGILESPVFCNLKPAPLPSSVVKDDAAKLDAMTFNLEKRLDGLEKSEPILGICRPSALCTY